MTGYRVYLQPCEYVLNAIHDIKEMQNGKGVLSDVGSGMINFTVRMYHLKYEYQFYVTDIGKNRSKVEISIAGDVRSKDEKILREYALLDSMLIANTQIDLMKAKPDD